MKFRGVHASRVSSTIRQWSRKWPMDAKPYVQSSFAVTSRTQSQHQAPFWAILREIESTICWFFGSPSVRCQLLGNAKPILVAARDQKSPIFKMVSLNILITFII